MGRKLSNQTIELLAAYMTDCEAAYKTQIYFCFSNKEAGAEAYDLLKADLADVCNYDAWSGWFGWGDKRDFYLGFTDANVRAEVLSDIKRAVAEYNASTSSGSGIGPKLSSWATYLAIGAVAVVIIILLWRKFKG